MVKFLLVAFLVPFSLWAKVTLEAQSACPNCLLESCRWKIEAEAHANKEGKKIVFAWDKSVVSRHVEKPYAKPLQCNTDRSFNAKKGGYIKVWFEGEEKACDAMAVKDAAECGVHFIFGQEGPSPFPAGFSVQAPQGKKLKKVEHKSTLFLYCGDFSNEKMISSYTWDTVIGYDSALPKDGLYTENSAPIPGKESVK